MSRLWKRGSPRVLRFAACGLHASAQRRDYVSEGPDGEGATATNSTLDRLAWRRVQSLPGAKYQLGG